MKLGREIGWSENRHIRHRMFATVGPFVLTANPGAQLGFDSHTPAPVYLTGPAVPYFTILQ